MPPEQPTPGAPRIGDVVLYHDTDGAYRPAIVMAEPGSDPRADRAVGTEHLVCLAVLSTNPLRWAERFAAEGLGVTEWHDLPSRGIDAGRPPVPGHKVSDPEAPASPAPSSTATSTAAVVASLTKRLEADDLTPAARANLERRLERLGASVARASPPAPAPDVIPPPSPANDTKIDESGEAGGDAAGPIAAKIAELEKEQQAEGVPRKEVRALANRIAALRHAQAELAGDGK